MAHLRFVYFNIYIYFKLKLKTKAILEIKDSFTEKKM